MTIDEKDEMDEIEQIETTIRELGFKSPECIFTKDDSRGKGYGEWHVTVTAMNPPEIEVRHFSNGLLDFAFYFQGEMAIDYFQKWAKEML